MRTLVAAGRAALPVLLLVACSDAGTAPPLEFDASFGRAGPSGHAGTHLTGAEEVPPNDSRAQGQATFRVSPDGSSISFRLNIANIENVLMAHIHLAPAGENGGIVVWLRPDAPPPQLIPGRFDGVFAVGTFTEANLVGALEDEPLSALIDAMRAGNTYVNVHTSQLPGGEIRGQIEVRN